ncbi:uncharacterized protein DFL_006736 [Arthrobotrys flagrans]|uniref:NADP-dependent oxidoreductase domain-containing protein n=1 Tax=Arthrobotrys flagrans TaxID=97331 RepID=A0A436ZUA0_ARTFL|nr:hypothetical protein DFL_006736 [Arthrobotrys flagrans]
MLRSLPRSRVASRPLLLHPHLRHLGTTFPIPVGKEDDPLDYEAIRAALDAKYPTYTPVAPVRPRPSVASKRQLRIRNLVSRPIPTFTLSNGLSVPSLGYQAYTHRDQKPRPWKNLIWKGYRHIDMNSAFNRPEMYLQNSFWSLANDITRSDLFVSAKLDSWWHHNPKASLYHTLLGLRTGYIDLWIMRWPVSWASKTDRSVPPRDKNGKEIDFIQAWKGMEEQLEAGKVKSLGISGFSKAELDLLLQHAKHKPVVHQMEITPYLQQTEFVEYNKSLGITPAATMPIGTSSAEKSEAYSALLQDPVLTSIAEKYEINVRQLLVAWNNSNSIISIPYLDDAIHPYENLRVNSLTLEQEDLDKIASLERGQRLYKPRLLGYYPFSDLTDPDLSLETDDLPTLQDIYKRRKENARLARERAEAEEAALAGAEDRFGTTTYAGRVFGWVRSMDGSRKSADNRTGHFGPEMRPPKKR